MHHKIILKHQRQGLDDQWIIINQQKFWLCNVIDRILPRRFEEECFSS